MDIKSVEFSRAVYQPGDLPRDQRPQFAFAGRSNVGKSSLINAVLKRKAIARVSQTPGKTQAVQFYLVNDRFYLVDLPGYGYAKVPQSVKRTWGALVHGYVESSDALRLIFLLLDVRRIPSAEDLQMHAWSQAAGIEEWILLTKTDKLSSNGIATQKQAIAAALEIDPDLLIATSAETNRGIEEARREIASRLL
ncbi:MAG TPA: ribosome biogenesis GTP-binding protein YihA/YsxC [Thermoanaerobaculia bacterium]|nr:ribosome biogenesis GTP-binding protein YihA/YsxC [Thermoanaerobaculia bacterium]